MGRRKKKRAFAVDAEVTRPGREEGRRERHEAGSRSAAAAHQLMELRPAAFRDLELDDELREEIESSRRITAHGARRREERRLAGILRGDALEHVESELSKVEGQGRADALQFKRAESWRERLLDEESNTAEEAVALFLAEVGGGNTAALVRQVEDARRQAATGRGGAAKELFRQIIAAQRARDRASR
jgi:ribosome-associated protein